MTPPRCILHGGCPWSDTSWVCRKSCEQQHARELSERWDAEDAEREARGVYRGCPVCKQKVLFQCHHDGQDIKTVDLPLPDGRSS